MTTEVLTALISASAAVTTAVFALVLNHSAFTALDNRISDTNRRIDGFKAEILRHLERIESDLKEFFKIQADHEKRIQRLDDKQ